jgi:hypothetical protein
MHQIRIKNYRIWYVTSFAVDKNQNNKKGTKTNIVKPINIKSILGNHLFLLLLLSAIFQSHVSF